jgi:hypothetical protein
MSGTFTSFILAGICCLNIFTYQSRLNDYKVKTKALISAAKNSAARSPYTETELLKAIQALEETK